MNAIIKTYGGKYKDIIKKLPYDDIYTGCVCYGIFSISRTQVYKQLGFAPENIVGTPVKTLLEFLYKTNKRWADSPKGYCSGSPTHSDY